MFARRFRNRSLIEHDPPLTQSRYRNGETGARFAVGKTPPRPVWRIRSKVAQVASKHGDDWLKTRRSQRRRSLGQLPHALRRACARRGQADLALAVLNYADFASHALREICASYCSA